jgi:hypothetical protein
MSFIGGRDKKVLEIVINEEINNRIDSSMNKLIRQSAVLNMDIFQRFKVSKQTTE